MLSCYVYIHNKNRETAMPTRLQIAEKDIIGFFDGDNQKVYTYKSIGNVIRAHREFWRLAQGTTINAFIGYFENKGLITTVDIQGKYSDTRRYIWRDAPDYLIASSLKEEGYLSHYSAVFLNGLTEQIPKTIYLNFEQPTRPKPDGELQQGNIDRAFKNKVRVTTNEAYFSDIKVVLTNGKQTGKLGVLDVTYEGSELPVTDIERTLIDISVRPVYSGGVYEVLKAYRNARSGFSVNRLFAYLKKIDYKYPYHQTIGYYLEKAGYEPTFLNIFKELGLEYDFYLAHKMGETDYIKEWRLFVPKGF